MRLRSLFLAAATFVGISAVAGSSSAGVVDDLLTGPGGVLGQSLTEVDEQTCPTFGGIPVVGQTLCSLSVAGIRYRTTFVRPDGTELVRTVNATAAVPSLLRADDDLLPDLTATLVPKSTTRFELTIARSLHVAAYLPVKVELIVPDPTGGELPRENIYLGYDARPTGKTPNTWKGEARIIESTATRTALTFEVTRSDSPAVSRIATIGGLFDGDPGTRTNPISAVLDQQPMPKTFGARLVLAEDENGQDDMTIGVGASTPITLNADVVIAEGAERRTLNARATSLPTELTVDLDAIAPGRQKVTYVASSRVPTLSLDSDLRVNGVPKERLRLDLADVPTGIVFNQTSKQAGTVTTTDGPIGSALVQVSTRGYQVPLLPLQGAFAHYATPDGFTTPGAPSMLAVRVEKLRNAAYDVGEDTSVDLETDLITQPPFRQDLAIRAVEKNRTVEATVIRLPQHVTFSATKAGDITYDGHAATVPEVTAKIRALNGTTLSPDVRYTGVDAKITDLPALLDVSIAPDNNRFSADMNGQTVGTLEAHAFATGSSCIGQLANAAGPLFGAAVVDTPAAACVAGRFAGLMFADVTLEPMDVTVRSAAAQKLHVFGTFNEPGDAQQLDGTLTGVVDQMPTEFSLTETPVTVPGAEGPVLQATTYDVAANADVGLVTINGNRLPVPTFPAEILNLRVESIPKNLHLQLPADGAPQKMVADVNVPDEPDANVGLVEMEKRTGTGLSCIANLEGRSGMAFVDTPAHQCTGLRIRGLEDAVVALDPLLIDVTTAATQVFKISGAVDDPADNVAGPGVLTGEIQALPTRLDLHQGSGTIAHDPDGRTTTITVDEAFPNIGALRLQGHNLPERFPARVLDAEILNVPNRAFISLPAEGTIKDVIVDTFGEGIGMVRFELNDGVSPVTTEAGKDHVKVRGSNMAFRAYDVETVKFRAPLALGESMEGTISAQLDHDLAPEAPSKDLDVDIQTGDATGDSVVKARIANPPHQLKFTRSGRFNPGNAVELKRDLISLDAAKKIDNLYFEFQKVGLDERFEVDASNLPKKFDLCVWNDEKGPNDQPPNWHPASTSPSWCYTPVKAPWNPGVTDPYVAFDTIQLSLDTPEPMTEPLLINRVVIQGRDADGLAKTTVSDVAVGEFAFAFGKGTLPMPSTPEGRADMLAMYGSLFDSDPENAIMDNYTWNQGLHLFLNTDNLKIKAKLAYDFTPNGETEPEETRLEVEEPLFARNEVVVLDMNTVPTQAYESGYIGLCDITSPTKLNLKLPGHAPFGPITIADFLDCDYTDNDVED